LHRKPYLLFDAGGTVVFPDQQFLITVAALHGMKLTDQQLFLAYYQIIYDLDKEAHQNPPFPSDPWPKGYAYKLCSTLGLPDSVTADLARAWNSRHREKNLWTFTFDWIRHALRDLRESGYSMSVFSNSDGRTAQVFKDLELDRFFDHIFDSVDLGVEKPHREAFTLILRRLRRRPEEVINIGDIYTVDTWGARAVGLGAIHIDPLSRCGHWPGVHLPSVSVLPIWLESYLAQPDGYPLFEPQRVGHLEWSKGASRSNVRPETRRSRRANWLCRLRTFLGAPNGPVPMLDRKGKQRQAT
jgi:putative hydrolase of the HAD superfamily